MTRHSWGGGMAHEVTEPDRTVAGTGEVYQVQRRPGQPHVVVNDGYRGLRVIDPWREQDVLRLPFSPGYDPAGVVDAWCFRADGRAALVMSETGRRACLLPLSEDGVSHDLTGPEATSLTDLRYVWEDDSLWLTVGKSYAFWHLQEQPDTARLVEASGIAVRRAHPRWRRAIDELPTQGASVLRIEPDTARLLYHDYSTEPGRIGVASWTDERSWSIAAPPEVPRLAYLPGRLFVRHDTRVQMFDEQGEALANFLAPPGFQFGDLDTLPARGDDPSALVVACLSLSDRQHDHLRLFRIEP